MLNNCRPHTSPVLTQRVERLLTTDWDVVLGRDNPEEDKIPTADDLIDAAREAVWDKHVRGQARGARAPPMSPLELRAVLKNLMQQRRDKVLPRNSTSDPRAIETVRGVDRCRN
jgi:hypothetical protein